MNRRGFLRALGVGAAVAATDLVVPNKTFFLPPERGWRNPTTLDGTYREIDLSQYGSRDPLHPPVTYTAIDFGVLRDQMVAVLTGPAAGRNYAPLDDFRTFDANVILSLGGVEVQPGDYITVDGNTHVVTAVHSPDTLSVAGMDDLLRLPGWSRMEIDAALVGSRP